MALSLPRSRILPIGIIGSGITNEVELIFTLPETEDFGPAFVSTLTLFHQMQLRLSRSLLRLFSRFGPPDHPKKGNYRCYNFNGRDHFSG